MGRPALEDEKSKKLLLLGTLGIGSMTLKGMDTSDLAAAEGSDLYAMLVLTLAMVLLTGLLVGITLLCGLGGLRGGGDYIESTADAKGYIDVAMEKLDEIYDREIKEKKVHGIGKKVNMGLWMILLVTQVKAVKSQPGEDEEADRALVGCMILYTTVVVLLTLLVQHGGRRLAVALHGLTSMGRRALREEESGHVEAENLAENSEDSVNAEDAMNSENLAEDNHTTHSYEADEERTQVGLVSEDETVDNRDDAMSTATLVQDDVASTTTILPIEREGPPSPFNIFGDVSTGPRRMLQIPEDVDDEIYSLSENVEQMVNSNAAMDMETDEDATLQTAPWRTSSTQTTTSGDAHGGPLHLRDGPQDLRDGPQDLRDRPRDVRDGVLGGPGRGDASAVGERLTRPARERRMMFVTAHGEKYHYSDQCHALARSTNVQRMELCSVCTVEELDRQPLFRQHGPVLHRDSEHACLTMQHRGSRRLKAYTVCSECYVRRGSPGRG